MMDKITNDNEPIDYEKLTKESEIPRKDSMSFTKRRSFILTNKEQLPKFILSNFLVNSFNLIYLFRFRKRKPT